MANQKAVTHAQPHPFPQSEETRTVFISLGFSVFLCVCVCVCVLLWPLKGVKGKPRLAWWADMAYPSYEWDASSAGRDAQARTLPSVLGISRSRVGRVLRGPWSRSWSSALGDSFIAYRVPPKPSSALSGCLLWKQFSEGRGTSGGDSLSLRVDQGLSAGRGRRRRSPRRTPALCHR